MVRRTWVWWGKISREVDAELLKLVKVKSYDLENEIEG